MKLFAAHALLPNGWRRDVRLETDAEGRIASIEPGAEREGAEPVRGYLVPGMPNLHSHAFQRAMAGLAEARTDATSSFWTWRELMYRLAARITPEQMGVVAAYLYVEMLKAGFTSVCEFHYLHHDFGGKPFEDRREMSNRIVGAAATAGIALTHLPTLYAHGGFGGQPPRRGQDRFLNSMDAFLRLVEALHSTYSSLPSLRLGVAFHSLRAVDGAMIGSVCEALARISPAAPIHVHVAEQVQEVEECLQWSGKRPVEWLLDNAPIDDRWCLVHATHLGEAEAARLSATRAVVGLCPTTEANLGDGIFPAASFLESGGRFGIGSDSHVSVSVAEELRTLEYGQRLVTHQRAVLANRGQPSPGSRAFAAACESGAQASGIASGRLAVGCRADLVVLDAEHPALWNKQPEQVLDAWIFAGDSACVRDVAIAGEWCIRERRHKLDEELAAAYRRAQEQLLAQ